ncbi:hypothetical protein [Paenibacillus daejeonensis]|uniref:hypothetical protein n=1 Tax=Paenibacillus daejeonensis TaxID=135193 RepID=UPI0003674DA3|nr:hypothetical protein [Paenibacillus daejeonensis]
MSHLQTLRERLRSKHAPTLLFATAGLALFALVILLLWVVLPQARERASMTSELRVLEQEVGMLRQEASTRGVGSEYDELASRLPEGLDVAGMLDEIMELAEASDVQLQDMKQNKPDMQLNNGSSAMEAAVELTLSGSLTGMLQMLDRIHQSERLYAVKWWNYRQLAAGETDVMAFERASVSPVAGDATAGASGPAIATGSRYAMTLLVTGYGRSSGGSAYDAEAARAALTERFPELKMAD